MAMELDLAELKRACGDDLAKTQAIYTHWYGYNQLRKNWLFFASMIAGVGTLLTAVILQGLALKICAAVFGALSTIAAALQRFARAGAKAEFYGGQVKEIHVLWLRTQFVKTEPELLKNCGAIRGDPPSRRQAITGPGRQQITQRRNGRPEEEARNQEEARIRES